MGRYGGNIKYQKAREREKCLDVEAVGQYAYNLEYGSEIKEEKSIEERIPANSRNPGGNRLRDRCFNAD